MEMLKRRRPLWLILTLLALASLAVVGMTVAQTSTEGTEPGAFLPASSPGVSYDSATSTGPAPDDNPATVANYSVAQAPLFRYYMVSGATLRGRNSDTTYAYDSLGCSYVTGGSSRILNTELPIPAGSTIKYLRVYYNDTNAAAGVRGYITRYKPGEAISDLVQATSSVTSTSGVGFAVSNEITETVSLDTYAYTLIGWPDTTGATSEICGLRVAYYPPTNMFLPTVNR